MDLEEYQATRKRNFKKENFTRDEVKNLTCKLSILFVDVVQKSILEESKEKYFELWNKILNEGGI